MSVSFNRMRVTIVRKIEHHRVGSRKVLRDKLVTLVNIMYGKGVGMKNIGGVDISAEIWGLGPS
jgi:hypothetical protein